MDTLENEAGRRGRVLIAGVDEAGRGPLAGPVVAAVVILQPPYPLSLGIRDSKKLTPKSRLELSATIKRIAVGWAVGVAWPDEIDAMNIHAASLEAMKRAVDALAPRPDFILVDGKFGLDTGIPQRPVIGGDDLSVSIAAASIIAKVLRDRVMDAYHVIYPGYGFASHKGYGTAEHKRAIAALGPTPIHRKSFRWA